jgi:hypothetical protein
MQQPRHLWQPDQLAELLAGAGPNVVAKIRFPEEPRSRPQVLLAAERPV